MMSSAPSAARDVLAPDHPLCRLLDQIDLVARQVMSCLALLVGITAACFPDISRAGVLAVVDLLTAGALSGLLLALRHERYRRARRVIIERGPANLAELQPVCQHLVDPAHREHLAEELTQALASAVNWHRQPVATRPPPSIRALAPHEDCVQAISTALRNDTADIRAVAMVEELLDGGYTAALYQHDAVTLGQQLRRITHRCRAELPAGHGE